MIEKKPAGRPRKAKEPTLEELRKEKLQGKPPTFIDKNEAALRKLLFENDIKEAEDTEQSPYYEEERVLEHQKRDGL